MINGTRFTDSKEIFSRQSIFPIETEKNILDPDDENEYTFKFRYEYFTSSNLDDIFDQQPHQGNDWFTEYELEDEI